MMTTDQQQLVTDNIRLATVFAKEYRYSCLEWEDLLSLEYMGLIKAATHPQLPSYHFQTLAKLCVRSEITHAIDKAVRLYRREPLRLDAPLGEDDFCLRDVIPCDNDPFILDLENQDLYASMRLCVAALSFNEKTALKMRFGLDKDERFKNKEIAKVLSCRPGQIGRIVKRGCAKLRASLSDPPSSSSSL